MSWIQLNGTSFLGWVIGGLLIVSLLLIWLNKRYWDWAKPIGSDDDEGVSDLRLPSLNKIQLDLWAADQHGR